MIWRAMWIFSTILALFAGISADGARLKDLATIRGQRDNQLIGYGMVVGLPGTGDRGGDFTEASLGTALKGMGVDPKSLRIGTKNSAAVMVTAVLPPFAKVGSKIDVNVASIASASSLEGGTLVMTPLKGADGKVYAIGQGRITVVKRTERGTSALMAMLSAVIPDGAILERDVDYDFSSQKQIKYQLLNPDFTTAARVAQTINDELGGKYATPVDAGTVELIFPYGIAETPVDVIAKLESLDIEPDRRAKVVVNRKTGTIVLGEAVRIFPISIAHNNLRIQVRDNGRDVSSAPQDSQANDPVPGGVPAAPQRAPRQMTMGNRPPNIADVVTSLNEVGASPDDLVFILQALKSSGSLIAELELQ